MAARSLAGEALESFRQRQRLRRYFLPAAEMERVEGRLPCSFFRVERFLLVRLFLEPFLRRRFDPLRFRRRFFVPRRRRRLVRRPPLRRRRVDLRRRRFVILPFEKRFIIFFLSRFRIVFQRFTREISFLVETFFSFFL